MHLLILLASATAAAAAAGNPETRRVEFNWESKCPADNSSLTKLRQLDGSQDERTCLVECASISDCSVMHRRQDSTCYFGTALQLVTLFAETGLPGCVSRVRIKNGTPGDMRPTGISTGNASTNALTTTTRSTTTPTTATPTTTTPTTTTPTTTTPTTTTPTTATSTKTTPATITPAATTTTATVPMETTPIVSVPSGLTASVFSKLLILFDFRQGFQNLANPSKYMATPRGSVSRDTRGASFSGSTSDFIDVDTDGGTLAATYLDHPRNFTFFAKVLRRTYHQQNYHYFHDCSGGFSGRFGDRAGRLWVEHPFPSQPAFPDFKQTRQSIPTSLSTNNVAHLVSAAVVFTGKTLRNFYLNQSNLATESDQKWAGTAAPLCLRLGFDSSSNVALNGLMICYSVASDALSIPELQQLDSFCGG